MLPSRRNLLVADAEYQLHRVSGLDNAHKPPPVSGNEPDANFVKVTGRHSARLPILPHQWRACSAKLRCPPDTPNQWPLGWESTPTTVAFVVIRPRPARLTVGMCRVRRLSAPMAWT